MGIRGLTPLAAKAQILLLACPLRLTSTPCFGSRGISSLPSQMGDKDVQCTVLSVKPSGLTGLCLAFWLVTPFLSNSLKALVTGTVSDGFPSVTVVPQRLVFEVSFHDVLSTAPSPSPGGDEKVILIFQRSPVNYSTGRCIAYPLHWKAQAFL